MEVRYLDIELMEKMCHRLAVAVFDKEDDPIPPFRDHVKSLLDSALNLPRATFDSKELYPSLVDKAAILYYVLNKNHPFDNGNKRLATAALLVFLYINDHWLVASIDEMVYKSLSIARSEPLRKDEILAETKKWIANHVEPVVQNRGKSKK